MEKGNRVSADLALRRDINNNLRTKKMRLFKLLFALGLCLSFVSACIMTPSRQFGGCGYNINTGLSDIERWQVLSAPPNQSEALSQIALRNPPHVGYIPNKRKTWFRTKNNSEIMLCQTDRLLSDACGGVWWQFNDSPDNPTVSDQGYWLCAE